MFSHTGSAPPSVFREPVETDADPNEAECSQLVVVQLKESRRSSGLRDEVYFNGVNCYQVKVPPSTVAIKFGLRALSGPSRSVPPVYSSVTGWPRGLKLEQLHFTADDDDVAYAAPIDLGGSGTLFLKLRGGSVLPLDYQLWFVQVTSTERGSLSAEPGRPWYSWAEALALNPHARLALGVYFVLAAAVALALSHRTVQVRPKTLAVAYIIWLTFGALAGHRFYLNRTATGIIWYFSVAALSLGLALDFTLIHSNWSQYVHHHLLWGALLGLTIGGMGVDAVRLPSMARDRTYWERAQPKRRKKPNRHRHDQGEAAEGLLDEAASAEEGDPTGTALRRVQVRLDGDGLPLGVPVTGRSVAASGVAESVQVGLPVTVGQVSVRGPRQSSTDGVRNLRAELSVGVESASAVTGPGRASDQVDGAESEGGGLGGRAGGVARRVEVAWD